MISGRTRVFALLGNPVGHSLSPAMHNAAFKALGLDAVYVAVPCEEPLVAPLMRALAHSGGGGNVTIPHKRAAAAIVNSGAAVPLASCNTFWGEAGQLLGDDTDAIGIHAGFEQLGRPAGTWLILGTGGSAIATAMAARDLGIPVVIRSRSADRRAALADQLRTLGVAQGSEREAGMVVNCTPLGLGPGDPAPMPVDQIPAGAAVLDLVYGLADTDWVRRTKAAGHRAVDGREVLVAQGAAAFERWFPRSTAPIEVMRAAVAGRAG